MLPKLFFGYFSIAMIILSLLIITRKNPVHSILWMLVLFFHIAGLYLFLDAEFLAAVQLILYAGAILVLFLFVIMMLNLKREVTAERFSGEWPIAVFVGGSLLVLHFYGNCHINSWSARQVYHRDYRGRDPFQGNGGVLYTEFLFPFEIASLILLIAVVGAIVLAKKQKV